MVADVLFPSIQYIAATDCRCADQIKWRRRHYHDRLVHSMAHPYCDRVVYICIIKQNKKRTDRMVQTCEFHISKDLCSIGFCRSHSYFHGVFIIVSKGGYTRRRLYTPILPMGSFFSTLLRYRIGHSNSKSIQLNTVKRAPPLLKNFFFINPNIPWY